MRGDAFVFHLAGGAFRVVPWLAHELTRRLVEIAPRSTVQMLDAEPAVGAVWLALAEARGRAVVPQYKPVMADETQSRHGCWLMAHGRALRHLPLPSAISHDL